MIYNSKRWMIVSLNKKIINFSFSVLYYGFRHAKLLIIQFYYIQLLKINKYNLVENDIINLFKNL